MSHCFDQQAFLRFARDNRCPIIPSLKQPFPRIQHESAFYFVRLVAVAVVAILLENRFDLLFIKLDLLAREFYRIIRPRPPLPFAQRPEQNPKPDHHECEHKCKLQRCSVADWIPGRNIAARAALSVFVNHNRQCNEHERER